MKNKLLILMMLCLGACQSANNITPKRALVQTGKVKARVTFWTNTTCPYGTRIASSNKRAKEGVTVAAPKKYEFETKIAIPGLRGVQNLNQDNILNIEDRGSAVEKLVASQGTADVFDVYVHTDTRREGTRRIKYLSSINPDYFIVDIFTRS